MRFYEILAEMSNIVISEPSEPLISVFCRPQENAGFRHWKSVKVKGPNNTYGVVPWGSDKEITGNLDTRTKSAVLAFIETYEFLLDALSGRHKRRAYKTTSFRAWIRGE